jgi:potassium-transporting ATPase potassium-binding subunit
MTFQGTAQLIFYAIVLTGLAYPLGIYMARVYEGKIGLVNGRLAVGERWFLRIVGSDPEHEQNWKQYAGSTLVFTIVFVVLLYLLLRSQGHLPVNPDDLPGVSAPIALNTAASFVTNTNWQYYGGEYTMSYLSQMAGLAVQNFVSAAVGMAVLAAVIRGFSRRTTTDIGNFWRDLYRSLVYILLPLAVVLGIILISQGVPQTFDGHATATTLQGGHQAIARGPVASQIAIKQLGTNGGGFYNSNSAVPFENPNGFTNFLEDIAILLIPMAQVFMFGRMIGRMRQGWAIWGAMFVLMVAGVAITYPAEGHGSQVLRDSGVNITAGSQQSGGNMQDKEVRFGIADTSLWASTTTNASNGSVNGGHDALTPTGGAVPLVNMFFGEVIWGGVGSGLYGMFFYVLIAVFVAGLMVGRTPEYLGKKIEAREIKIAAVGALFVPTMALVLAAISVVTHAGLASIFNSGAHGFTEALYAYTSQSNNNGSAFAGYGALPFSANLGAVALYLGRFVPLLAALAVGGTLAAKKTHPESAGTFKTDGPTFAVLLVAIIVLTAGLMIFPALTLGPIVEALS